MKDILRLSIILALICALAGAALAGTHSYTSQIIAERQKSEQLALLSEFIPGVAEFAESSEGGYTIFVGKKSGQLAGIVAIFTEGGYKGGIQMMLGVDASGQISGFKILSQSETPSLGARIIEPAFTGQYLGKKQTDPIALGQDISAISGATISSRAVTSGVRKAVDMIGAKYLGAVAPVEEPVNLDAVADGTYQGTGEGLMGDILVEVTVESHKIKSIKILSDSETREIAGPAKANVPKWMIEQQKVDVDVESGATYTSKGIIAAVKNALQQ